MRTFRSKVCIYIVFQYFEVRCSVHQRLVDVHDMYILHIETGLKPIEICMVMPRMLGKGKGMSSHTSSSGPTYSIIPYPPSSHSPSQHPVEPIKTIGTCYSLGRPFREIFSTWSPKMVPSSYDQNIKFTES